MGSKYVVAALERGLKVLDTFEPSAPEMRLTDISERLNISKSLAFRIVSTLEAGGYLTRDPDTKRYRLGVRVLQLGLVAGQYVDLRRIAQPVLRRLAEETRETVGLVAVEGGEPICVDVIESPQGVRVFAQAGRRMPWHAGSSGKVILAYLPHDEQERILTTHLFETFTAETVTDPRKLRDTLLDIRRAGYYVGINDLDAHALGVAAPILDHLGHVCGALSVSAPTSRIAEPRHIDLLAEKICAAAELISTQLGCGETHRGHERSRLATR